MKKKSKKILISSTMVSLMMVGFVTAFLVAPSFMAPLQPERSWGSVSAADATVGSSESGIVNVYIYPYQADTSTYDSALSEATAYAHFDDTPSLDEALEGDVPYDTRYDIAITVQFNGTVAYNTTTSSFDKDYVRAWINSTDLSLSEQLLSEGDWYAQDGTNDATINFYYQDASFELAHGVEVTVDDLVVQGFW
jgi:hypothetical protein